MKVQLHLLVNGILELRRLCPFANLARSTSEKTADDCKLTCIVFHAGGNILGLDEDNEEVDDLRQVEQHQETTKPDRA